MFRDVEIVNSHVPVGSDGRRGGLGGCWHRGTIIQKSEVRSQK
jgi:hypothetical protein